MSKLDTSIEHVRGTEKQCIVRDSDGEYKEYTPDSAEWFAWLSSQKAVRFVGLQGNFTARREIIVGKDKKQRGGQYWFAYRKLKGRQFKRYLGLTQKLTLDHLEDAARRIEVAIREKFGISAEEKIPNASSSKQSNEKLLQSRIEELEQTIAEQSARIQELDAQLQAKPTPKRKALPKADTAPPEGFVWLSDFCTLHHVPYQAAEALFPWAIRGQKITAQRRLHPIIGAKGRHDFWVQMHTRADFVACDDCPHKEMVELPKKED